MRGTGHVHSWGRGKVYTGFWWAKLRGKKPLGKPRLRREDNMVDLQEVGHGGMDWIDLAQERDS